MTFVFPRYWLQTGSWLGMGLCVHWICAGLAMLSSSFGIHMSVSYLVSLIYCFLGVIYHLWLFVKTIHCKNLMRVEWWSAIWNSNISLRVPGLWPVKSQAIGFLAGLCIVSSVHGVDIKFKQNVVGYFRNICVTM